MKKSKTHSLLPFVGQPVKSPVGYGPLTKLYDRLERQIKREAKAIKVFKRRSFQSGLAVGKLATLRVVHQWIEEGV